MAETIKPGETYEYPIPGGKLVIKSIPELTNSGIDISFISDNNPETYRSHILIEKSYDKQNNCYNKPEVVIIDDTSKSVYRYIIESDKKIDDYHMTDETIRLALMLSQKALELIENNPDTSASTKLTIYTVDSEKTIQIRVIRTSYQNQETGEKITESPMIDFRFKNRTGKEIYSHSEINREDILRAAVNFIHKIKEN